MLGATPPARQGREEPGESHTRGELRGSVTTLTAPDALPLEGKLTPMPQHSKSI